MTRSENKEPAKYMKLAVKQANYDVLKELGVKPERLVADIIDLYVDAVGIDLAKVFKIATLRAWIAELEIEFKAVESKREYYEYMKEQLKIAEQEYNDSEVKAASYIVKLDKVIIGCQYNINEVKERYSDLLDEIKQLVPSFDLNNHVLQVKKINEKPFKTKIEI